MRQRRTDSPVHMTFALPSEVRDLVDSLERHFRDKEQARVTKSQVVERAVRALAKKVNGGGKG